MGKALYRKYRSKKLSDVVGQSHITTTLTNALKSGALSHAYLLTGPRGTGKTSIARILAYEINGLSYEANDQTHLDVIEIDAASNRRIDEIRELRDKVHLAPSSAKYKVYIIDEVHMLTREAFNALLKTLEEPPEHVVFILATTELHKLPETIISRTQRFGLRPIAISDMVPHLKSIAQSEKITIDESGLEAIAAHARGSFRDAISLLDQARGLEKDITAEDVAVLLGKVSATELEAARSALQAGDIHSALSVIKDFYDAGASPEAVAAQLAENLRQDMHMSQNRDLALKILPELLQVQTSAHPEIALELALMHTLTEDELSKPAIKPAKIKKAAPAPEPAAKKEPAAEPPKPPKKKPAQPADQEVIKKWPEILEAIKGQHNTFYGVLRLAEVSINSAGALELAFQFPFHVKRASEARYQNFIKKALKDITGKSYEISYVKRTIEKPKEPTVNKKDDVGAIRDVFGGGEVMN